jgi:hypothetical protein
MLNYLAFFNITIALAIFDVHAFDESQYSNSNRLRACDLLMAAEKICNEDRSDQLLKEAEAKILKALSLVPTSVDQLNFIRMEPRLHHNSGRWAKFRDVPVDRYCTYNPHEMLGKIRMKIPPQPWAKASLYQTRSGSLVLLKLNNIGKSTMQNIEINLVSDSLPSPSPKTIPELKPGEKKIIKWSTRMNILNESFRIVFKEAYGFVPCALNF